MKDKLKSFYNGTATERKKKVTIMLNKSSWIQKDIGYKGKNKHINLARNIA